MTLGHLLVVVSCKKSVSPNSAVVSSSPKSILFLLSQFQQGFVWYSLRSMAMMHAGMGLSRIIVLIGAGYGGAVMLRNGRLSDVLGELQGLVKGLEKEKKESGSDDVGDAIAAQVRRLADEVRRLSARPIILNGGGQAGNLTSLLVPAAAVGMAGYGYMWWKGFSFSDLMYVTKKSMSNAVSNMTKHLEQLSTALAATKRHLTQRIENLDGKLDEQKVISKEIANELTDIRGKVANNSFELESLSGLIWQMDGRINSIDDKQDFTCAGVAYLCQVVADNGYELPSFLKDVPKTKRQYLGHKQEGLKAIMGAFESGTLDAPKIDNDPKDINSVGSLKSLSRIVSIKCV